MSLTEQLKALAAPISTSYVVDNVGRKSLVYSNPSKVDTLTCYQKASKHFKNLCQRDNLFVRFENTLFAETTCHLDMCNLLACEKEKFDKEISSFLCFISPYIKHFDSVYVLEWLVYKFQVHLHYTEHFIRCVIPYHETAIFVKFIQLLDLKSLPSAFQWVIPFAKSGKSIPRAEFARLCFCEKNLIPFVCSSILFHMEHCVDTSSVLLNDMANFFLATISAICDSHVSDKRLSKAVDSFQGVIYHGLLAMNAVPFQCASYLVVVRLSVKLTMNHDLILHWISGILKKTRPGSEWESVRLVMQLMRNQNIALLPNKLSSRFTDLMSKLTPAQRQLIESEENALLDSADANKLASQCEKLAYIRSATQYVDTEPVGAIMKQSTGGQSSETNSNIDRLLAFLASFSKASNSTSNENCFKQVPLSIDSFYLSNVVRDILLPHRTNAARHSKAEIHHHVKLLEYFRSAVTLLSEYQQKSDASTHTPKSRSTKRLSGSKNLSSPSIALLEQGIDHALPLLLACLLHPVPIIRVGAYDILNSCFFIQQSIVADSSNFSNFQKLFSILNPNYHSTFQSNVFCEQIKESLCGDPLNRLDKIATPLQKACVHLFFSQPLELNCDERIPEHRYSFICWSHGFQLLNEDTVVELFAISPTSEPSVVGWTAFLELIGTSHYPFTGLHEHCFACLTENLYRSLAKFNSSALVSCTEISSDQKSTRRKSTSRVALANRSTVCAQIQLLDALYSVATRDVSAMDYIGQIFSRLCLDAAHFDHFLIKLDSSRIVLADTKSLFARVRETRHRRNEDSSSQSVDCEELTSDEQAVDINRLRFLSMILSVLTDAIPRLQQKEWAAHTLAQSNHIMKIPVSTQKSCCKTADPPVYDLITPLINHLICILNKEQRLRKSKGCTGQVDNLDGSDSGDDSDNSRNLNLSAGLVTGTHQNEENMDISVQNVFTDFSGDSQSVIEENTSIYAMLKQCTYRLLVCVTVILTQVNRCHRSRGRRSHIKTNSGHLGMLCNQASLQAAVDPIFLCLTVFPNWVALHQQILLCFVELSALFPEVLCQQLVSLVHWVACNHHLIQLEHSHNLNLLGRLIVVAIPALIRASKRRVTSALDVLSLFVHSFVHFSDRLHRRRLALYTGLVRGLAQVTSPINLQGEVPLCKLNKHARKHNLELENIRKIQHKESWLGSWLWVTCLLFLNNNWENDSTVKQIGPFLINLFNQFSWDNQIFAWCECIAFLLFVCEQNARESNRTYMSEYAVSRNSNTDLESPCAKRRRLASGSLNDRTHQYLASGNDFQKSSPWSVVDQSIQSPEALYELMRFLFNSQHYTETNTDRLKMSLDAFSLWSLIDRVMQFLLTLILDPKYVMQVRTASEDPCGFGAVYLRLVKQMVRLMFSAGTAIETHKSASDKILKAASASLLSLQKGLIHILDSIPDPVFVSIVCDLFDSGNRAVRRKALELLSTKLCSLTEKLPSNPVLINPKKLKYATVMKAYKKRTQQSSCFVSSSLESGLIKITNRLGSSFDTRDDFSNAPTLGSVSSRQALFCLKDLAKLLAHRYPGEFMRLMDSLIANCDYWWPVESEGIRTRGSGLAESRSLACLYFIECIQHFPSQSFYPEASATAHRLAWLLRFSLDHVGTSSGFICGPYLSIKCKISGNDKSVNLAVGTLHSIDQHIQASLALIDSLLELAIVHQLSQQQCNSPSGNAIPAIGQWLEFEVTTKPARQHELVSTVLLSLVFRLSYSDLTSVTGCNPERSVSVLRHIDSLLQHVRLLLPRVTSLKNLLNSTRYIIESATDQSDILLLNGSLAFLRELGESVVPTKHADGAWIPEDKYLLQSLLYMDAANPEIMSQILLSVLRTSVIIDPSMNELCVTNVYQAVSAMSCALTSESRLRLYRIVFEWATVTSKPNEIVNRVPCLSVAFHIMERSVIHMRPEEFSELIHQLRVVDYIVFTFMLASGPNSKGLRKLAKQLDLSDLLQLASSVNISDMVTCVRSAMSCLNRWLLCEVEQGTCLSVVGSDSSVSSIASALLSLPDMEFGTSGLPPFTESDIEEVLSSYLKFICGDEAFLRPLGSALADQIMHANNWRTRLTAIRLLKFVFDHLSTHDPSATINSTDPLGSARCLISTTLAALSEALEDNRPEVEAEANKLFSELDQHKLSFIDQHFK